MLVAIAIPIFTKRLEGSRETTDLANLRSAYAAGQVALLSGDVATSGAATSAFDPDAATGLVASGSGAKIGKGTAVDGGVNAQMSGVPKAISENYSATTVASGKAIALKFANGSLSGVVFE